MSILYDNFFAKSKGGQRREEGGIVSWRNRFLELDRDDGPALIRESPNSRRILLSEGTLLPRLEYWCRGQRHRVGAPAVLFDPREALLFRAPLWEYWQRGKRNRLDGPAQTFVFGSKWYKEDLLHRLDGPAVDFFFEKRWYRDGLLSRSDGPAVIRSPERALFQMRPLFEWHLGGQLHRLNGPAVVYPSHGYKDIPLEEYWQNGELTRDDGPEIVWPDGQGWKRSGLWQSV